VWGPPDQKIVSFAEDYGTIVYGNEKSKIDLGMTNQSGTEFDKQKPSVLRRLRRVSTMGFVCSLCLTAGEAVASHSPRPQLLPLKNLPPEQKASFLTAYKEKRPAVLP